MTAALVVALPSTAGAQLDQLLFLKRVPPNVIVIVDTSFRMLDDGYGNYHDPHTYNSNADPAVARALGVPMGSETYRRIYRNLRLATVQDAGSKYEADTIEAVNESDAAAFAAFWRSTRFDIAQRGLARAVALNKGNRFRWGLMALPQTSPAWRTPSGAGCDRPVRIVNNPALAEAEDNSPGCAVGEDTFGIYAPSVAGENTAALDSTADRVTVAYNTAATVLSKVSHYLPDQGLDLIPAGVDTALGEDRPLTKALERAKWQVDAAVDGDTAVQACPECRNTVVVLIAGGDDPAQDAAAKAAQFLNLDINGVVRRVPIYVVGVKPAPSAEAELQAIATNSGGLYFNVDSAQGVTRVINLALQAGFGRWSEFNSGEASEYVTASPVIGTVNLKNAPGLPADETEVFTPQGLLIPQRNNIMITPGFALGKAAQAHNPWSPGFDGRLRAFRVFKPVVDGTKPAGYTFTKDGTPLWPDRDGRPHLAGMARPPEPNLRNIYTYIPGSGMVAFDANHVGALQPYLGVGDEEASRLITYVRSLPLGAVIGSTPAVMDPPSIDPPPDNQYGRPEGTGTYAGDHKNRRTIIWVGANDGMLHGIDARTGYEVWAFIPFNLLPKLWTLQEGQAVEQFSYFVDHSAKIADVKLSGNWRSYLVIGEGPGGTFYQAFDVTEAGMGGPPPDSDDYLGVLASFNDPGRVEFKWSFPSYTHFDPALKADITVADATPGNVVHFHGDLSAAATAAERTVGFAWSDPAVGPLDANRSVNVAIVGSGYFPAEAEAAGSPLLARRTVNVGRSFYLVRMEDGTLLGNSGGGACVGSGCLDVGDVNNSRKNALHADPTVTGDPGSYVAKRAYMGDVDGNYWRFNFGPSGAITKTLMYDTEQPIYASSALMTVGTLEQYVFFSTGSDMLPTTPSSAGGTGIFKLYGVRDLGAAGETAFTPVSLVETTDNAGVAAGERPSASPSVAGDIVFFTTTIESVTPSACADFQYNLWALTYRGGSAYVPTGEPADDGKKNKNEPPPPPAPALTGFGRATAPFVVDQHLYFGASGAGGASVEAFGDPNDFNNGVGQVGVRILSWREIRR